MKLLSLFKKRLFRIIFTVFLVIIGILTFQKYQDLQSPTCKDCNLILISVDTLRPDHMGVYGYDKNTTPNIDKWAKDATVFTNMRTVVPATFPSFSALMTGKGPFESRIFSNSLTYDGISNGFVPIDDKVQTIAQLLKASGFLTAAFINTPSLDGKLTKLDIGFDIYENDLEWPLQRDKNKDFYKSLTNVNNGMKWLTKNKDKRFFVWFHLMEPHSPYWPIDEYKCKFDQKYCTEINSQGLEKLEQERNELKECKTNRTGIGQDKIDLFTTLYDGGIASGDVLIGRIISTIHSLDLDKKTVVVLYGDHGEGFDHDYYFMHGGPLYDSHIKIPLIIKLPGGSGKKNSTSFQNTQIMNSLLNKLQIPHDKFDSSDIFLEKEPSKYIFSSNAGPTRYSVQNDRYKFIYSVRNQTCLYNNQTEELYDLTKDPSETKNLLESTPNIAKNLRETLFKYLATQNISSLNSNKTDIMPPTPQDNNILERLRSLGY